MVFHSFMLKNNSFFDFKQKRDSETLMDSHFTKFSLHGLMR